MGSCISDIENHYDKYEILCKKIGVEPKDYDKFIEHEKEILTKYKYQETYFGYKKIKNGR